MANPTNRFTKTVEDYVRYRPSYPRALLDVLKTQCNLTSETVIADIGSGTGLLTQLFLDNGNEVYGVEPNQAMREAGEQILTSYPRFHSINGSAEETTLTSQSIDLITAGTAFHWFHPEKTKIEFKRILKSPGWVALIWNVRDVTKSPLMQAYEDLILEFSKDYKQTNAEKFDKTIGETFFQPFAMQIAEFDNRQYFDWAGLKGRLLSSSFVPRSDDSRYENMLLALEEIFKHYQQHDKVAFIYTTKMYYGRIC